ncbi:MAG: glycoside hydrolase family 3 protein [Cyanobacteria bacterium REEB459]|nr:glycoside hydrolase family 3 protein [Cyanobacteria bacterium REEB459]
MLPAWQTLSLPQQVAQLLVVRTSGHLFDQEIRYPQWEAPASTLRHWIEDLGVGGVIVLGGSTAELQVRTQQMQSWSTVPLLMAADIEQGVGQRFAGATWMPPPMALGAIAQTDLPQACAHARAMGAITAEEATALGLNWMLAPIVDVNNNPDNPAISLRAFGETPDIVIPLTKAFLQGAQGYGLLTTAKHFPGHGDTTVDPHLDLPVIAHDRLHLEQIELAPFRAAIAAGVDTVMTAHLQVPALDPTYPATFSPLILTRLLRREMGFEGLIVTDALVMQAVTQRYGAYEAPILALAAGADILLMPVDPPGTIAAICQAIETGRLSRTRLQASLDRLWRAKQRLVQGKALPPSMAAVQGDVPATKGGLSPLPGEGWIAKVARPQASDRCRTILQQSLQLRLPSLLQSPPAQARQGLPQAGAINLILVDNLLQSSFLGLHTPAIAIPQAWGYRLQWVDRQTPAMDPTVEPQPTLLQVFIQANPFQTTAGLWQLTQRWLAALASTGNLQAVILYGSPYLWSQLLGQVPADIPALFSYGQLPMAQEIALEKLLQLGFGISSTPLIDQQFTT